MTSKITYQNLLKPLLSAPTAQKSLERVLKLTNIGWTKIYTFPRITTIESSLRTFQYKILNTIIPHQKPLQSDWSFTFQHFRCLALSTSESCRMIDIIPFKPNICHVRNIMLPCKPNIYHASFWKVILRRVACSDTYNP